MQIQEILNNFEDFELSFLMEFKYQTYMSGTKKAIDEEIKRRGLTERDLESLKQEEVKHNKLYNVFCN
ncbi:hypothetical protein [Plebeiibacterium sediminum]|uniref:Uncharacterized protein n=1 Tax=Plebeiibacterium sediminum TaxID=2992112 RepID=A0AAE3M302_9BACT|nr:hypothetical protein [Plebeiobacterium sediminum]MCW3786296.1 hypothetical protein [Plebeiobacterium sediminum]